MLNAIQRSFARRRLKPVVQVLPFELSRPFGTAEVYTRASVEKSHRHPKAQAGTHHLRARDRAEG